MPSRTFTVYRDAPSTKPSAPRLLGRSVSAAAVLTTSRRSESGIPSLPEKENLHPLTGLGTTSVTSSKKRKASDSNTVLKAKILCAPGSSGAAKSKPPKRADLKRKASSQASSAKTKAKKEQSGKTCEDRKALSDVAPASPANRATPSRLSSHSSSAISLETIKEEAATQSADEEKPGSDSKSLTQVLIDSRCYELTVSPLADVSDAYLQSSDTKKEEVRDEDASELHIVKEEPSFATQIRDYFLFEGPHMRPQSSIARSSGFGAIPFGAADELDFSDTLGFTAFDDTKSESADKTKPVTPKQPQRLTRSMSLPCTTRINAVEDDDDNTSPSFDPVTLSTPERKELYATFTFMTPKSSPVRPLSL
ncbi:uncharacterized protein FOMMEDRAFT_148838 [Fomitiporia mediterranea MF3/22]|uniref:uncharacterized protein n=1 Tax=Fomitiporia mediterranea (strain MF3/22) TaxID=694068 RepID=UPI0004408C19|nr:uncharacterized protein FOMMEDRAFT_148838 [Fomitiporia mediterranea MF3/22]EJC99356.1 hypothetical protein FOMMEDRAFT_148838 [Fomitiporia mediterranea MF3/22]